MKAVLLALSFALSAFQAAAEPLRQPPLLGDPNKAAQVWDSVVQWTDAYTRHDLKGVMAAFDAEEVFKFYGSRTQTYADLEAGYRAAFARPAAADAAVWIPLVDEVYAEGKTAFVRGIAERRVTAADGSVSVTERNQCIDIYRLHGAADWRIFRTLCYPEQNRQGGK
jgi:hypothetical protein